MLQLILFIFCMAKEADTVSRLAAVLVSGSTSRVLVANSRDLIFADFLHNVYHLHGDLQ